MMYYGFVETIYFYKFKCKQNGETKWLKQNGATKISRKTRIITNDAHKKKREGNARHVTWLKQNGVTNLLWC